MNQSGYQTVIVEIELEPKIIVAPHIDSELRRLQSGPAVTSAEHESDFEIVDDDAPKRLGPSRNASRSQAPVNFVSTATRTSFPRLNVLYFPFRVLTPS